MGWAYFKLGRLKEAEEELTKVTKSAPKSGYGFEHLGDVYQKMGNLEKARSCWETALSLLADDSEAESRIKVKIAP